MVACIPHHGKHPQNSGTSQLSYDEPSQTTKLLRADPGYVQWLIQQSFLYKARETNLLVSGTNVAWRHNASNVNHWPLLQKSSTWLYIAPKTIPPHPNNITTLTSLSQPSMIAALQQKGLSLYLSDLLESNSVWTSKVSLDFDTTATPPNTANRPISYDIAQSVGSEQDLMALHIALRQSNAMANTSPQSTLLPQLLGTDIIPASTALGPDFFLAARGHKEYIGTYAMIEIESHDWPLLPDIQDDWQCQALSKKEHEALAQKDIIPLRLNRDTQPNPYESGWAATGPVRGVDGNLRRWLYAYAENPMQAILHWNDPSANAKRIFSASIINNTGILGIPLVGLCLEDLYGFEPESIESTATASADNSSQTAPNNSLFHAEPMLTVATNLAHEIRSYGGWSWLQEALPTPLLRNFMQSAEHKSSGPDFFTSNLGKAMQEALEQNQAIPLHTYFDEILQRKIDSTRLAHIIPNVEQDKQEMPDFTEASSISNVLFATKFFASQSGLVVLPVENLAPLVLKFSNEHSTIQQIYAQSQKAVSFSDLQKSIMALPDFFTWREEHNIATARLIARLSSNATTLTLLSALANSYVLTISNFSDEPIQEDISLSDYIGQKTLQIQEIAQGPSFPEQDNSLLSEGDVSTMALKIPAKTCRIFMIKP